MARKKTIMKSSILDTAYQVVRTEGFTGFTARNIANEMNCSTQPIYLEFKNMDDLKKELLVRIEEHLVENVFNQDRTEKPILNAALNYLYFAKEEPVFFRALYLENSLNAKKIHDIAREVVIETFDEDKKTKDLDDEEKAKVFGLFWAGIHGAASMIAQGLLELDEEEVEEYTAQTLKTGVKIGQ